MCDFGLPSNATKKLMLTNVRTGKKDIIKDAYSVELEPHTCAVYAVEFVN